MRKFRRLARLLSASALVLALGCSTEEPSARYLDLLDDLPGLEKHVETRAIDFGAPEARADMVRGFSETSWDGKRERYFARGVGKRSVVRFALLEARDLQLVLEGRPVPRDASERVEIAVNRDVLGEIVLEPKLGRYKITLPRSALLVGENLLYLTYSGDAETVAWYRLQFSPGAAVARLPVNNRSAESLFLPFGSQVTVPVLAPPRSQLRFDKLGVRGESGRLKIDVRRDGAPDLVFEEAAAAESLAYDLELEDWTPVRLTLTAQSSAATGERDGVALVRPAVWSPERHFQMLPASQSTGGGGVKPANVIVYLVDTLRADRLGAYGYERPISPSIDAFAERATLFENAIAQTSWTRPAVASVFTGMWPAAHGVNRTKDRLPDETVTLAEVLSGAGYDTVGYVANPNVYRKFGLAQGFDLYRHMPGRKPPSDRINEEVGAWLDLRDPDRPFFLYVHTVDPHDPYEPPERFRRQHAPGTEDVLALPKKARWVKQHREALSDLYDAEIAFNDTSFGELVANLQARDLWDDTLVVFLSDHGEEFQEHGAWTHGRALFDESIRIPLIVKWPGQRKGERRRDLAQQIDVGSTILSELGLEWPEAFEGRDLARSAADHPPTAFSYLNYYGPLQLAAVREEWKLMVRVDRKSTWLFDRGTDPEETEDFTRDHQIRKDVFDSELAGALRPRPYWLTAGEAVIDKKLEEQLRALGYLN